MKKNIVYCLAFIAVLLFSFSAFSQEAARVPAWLSDKGYWVIETQLKEPKQATIRFYNNEDVLVGVSRVTGTRLNIKKAKVKMQLKAMLELSLQQWAKRQDRRVDDSTFAGKP